MKRTFLAVALVATGCGKKSDAPTSTSMKEDGVLAQLPAIDVTPKQMDVIVRVNDNKLTQKELEVQVKLRLGTRASGLTADQLRLAQQQIGPKVLEQFIAQSLLMDAARNAGVEVTEDEREKAFVKLDEKLQSQGSNLEQALKNSEHGAGFLKDEVLRGLHINKFLAQRLPKIPEPTPEEIDAVISSIPETVHARHILIKNAQTDDTEARITNRAKAEAIRKQLLDGGDFAASAKSHSDGPSAPKGGDLGRFHRGKMVPSFEEAAFSQEVGEIGQIVETKFGYHIIQVIDHIQAGAAPRNQIADQLRAQNRAGLVVELVRELIEGADFEYASSASALIPPAFRNRN